MEDLRKEITLSIREMFREYDFSDIEAINCAIIDDVVKDVLETSDYPNYNDSDIRIGIKRVVVKKIIEEFINQRAEKMSLHCAIIVKVKKADIGKAKKFNASKLPIPLCGWLGERCKEKSKKVELNDEYIGIYCHWNGSDVINVLRDKFKTYEDVLNLVLGGDCSHILEGSIKHYANRKGEEWDDFIKPKLGSSPFEVLEQISYSYAYLFENDEWKIKNGDSFYTIKTDEF